MLCLLQCTPIMTQCRCYCAALDVWGLSTLKESSAPWSPVHDYDVEMAETHPWNCSSHSISCFWSIKQCVEMLGCGIAAYNNDRGDLVCMLCLPLCTPIMAQCKCYCAALGIWGGWGSYYKERKQKTQIIFVMQKDRNNNPPQSWFGPSGETSHLTIFFTCVRAKICH